MSKTAKKIKDKIVINKIEAIIYPTHQSFVFKIFLLIAFLFPFVVYVLTLAPTVTLEDSGELITAAYTLGVPHEPGYPLFAMLGKIFTLFPFGNIAYRVNLMSAFLNALAALFIFRSFLLILEDIFIRTKFWKEQTTKNIKIFSYCIALSGSLFWAFANKIWEQSIIAEVYGVNDLLLALFLYFFMRWRRQTDELKRRIFFNYVCLITGFALTAHTTSAMLIPILGVYLIINERKLLFDFKKLLKPILSFFAGLLPWLYLPFASLANPPIDWGNPENILNFFRVITRHQYQSQDVSTNASGSDIFSFYFKELLPDQWYVLFLIFIPFGLYIIYKNAKPIFHFVLLFLLMSIPVLSYMTRDFLGNVENQSLVSVFYIPSYIMMSLLICVGMFYLVTAIMPKKLFMYICACVAIIAASSSILKNYKSLDMHKYYFAKTYADNIFNTLPQNSLLFINWDPFGFPLNYYQFVEKKRRDILVLDELLLKRSWYIEWLRNYYPDFMQLSKVEVEGFLFAVAPFEAGETYDGNLIQQKYIGMINSFIDNKTKVGRSVYFTYFPVKDILRNNNLEPQFSAYKYTKSSSLDSTITDQNVNVKTFLDPKITHDRMANYLMDYYGNQYGSRAEYIEKSGDHVKCIALYQKAIQLFGPFNKKSMYIKRRLQQINQNL